MRGRSDQNIVQITQKGTCLFVGSQINNIKRRDEDFSYIVKQKLMCGEFLLWENVHGYLLS